ncbi:MAG: antitoxin HicB [Muribaculaceae bacterium]|nr:antitoxin HicB [Muribaculaceae bacterium]
MDHKLIISICASKDSFGAFVENCEGIYASGDSVTEVKQDVLEAIRIYKEITPIDKWAHPIRENWPIEWHYDVQSLLLYYQGIFTNAALERMTGINQKQLWNYANGVSKPRKQVKEKIEKALHSLGQELLELSL